MHERKKGIVRIKHYSKTKNDIFLIVVQINIYRAPLWIVHEDNNVQENIDPVFDI